MVIYFALIKRGGVL